MDRSANFHSLFNWKRAVPLFSLRLSVTLLSLLVLCIGCGTDKGPATVPVSGVVTWKGEPVEGALVVFLPENASGESMLGAQAETDSAGNFAIQTYTGGGDMKDGIQPGVYKVTVTKLEVVQDMRRRPKNLLPPKYAEVRTTDLQATVTESGDQSFAFELK